MPFTPILFVRNKVKANPQINNKQNYLTFAKIFYMQIQSYNHIDKLKIVDLFELNVPKYFSPIEKEDLLYYLDHHAQHFYVIKDDDKIIGCGGINYFEEEGNARLSWDIFDPYHHGKGFGSVLTQFRITKIKENKNVKKVVVRTTQLTFRFYEKMGFHLVQTTPDYWAKGFDLYYMEFAI